MASAATLALLVGCSGGAEGRDVGAEPPEKASGADSAVFAAMDSAYQRFTRAYLRGEPDSVVVLYTDSPLYLPAAGDIRSGVVELRSQFAFLRALAEQGRVAHIRFESVERGVSGELAYDVGYYRIEVALPDGSRMPPSRGKFTTVWRRGADGGWRIHIDGFSPAPLDR